MSGAIGAIDQGTTSSRFIVFNADGRIAGLGQKEHRQIFPQPGWVEHDAEEILANTLEVIAAGLDAAGLTAADLACVGITNQRETTVVWDRHTGKPLCNALVWQDTRADSVVARLAADGGQDRLRSQTGLPLASYFSGAKLAWLLEHVPHVRAAADAGTALFGTIDSWLLWHLTGGPSDGRHATDVTNASRTQLMALDTLDWDDVLLATFNVPRTLLPQICPSGTRFGTIREGALKGVEIAGILGDQQAALVGQTCFVEGEAKNTYGTGCFLLMNTGTRPVPSTAGLATTLAYQFSGEPAHYALEGSIAITGSLVQWLRDNLGLIGQSHEVETQARSVDDNGDVYFVPAFSGLYAPYWRDDARGVVTGLTRFANRGHLARAALEATAYQTRDVLEAMEKDSGVPIRELRVDGGMVANELLMQFQADILDTAVVSPQVTETTALGAAYAAGLTVGFWENTDALRQNWQIAGRWQPIMAATERARLYHNWQKAVQRSMNWVEPPAGN